jgi:hypothetical protein
VRIIICKEGMMARWHSKRYKHPVIDGLQVQHHREPMDDTLVLVSVCNLAPAAYAAWMRTLEDIMCLPEWHVA